ncbi:MAG TPA: ATP-binding protein, partial [Candidatus Margulisiibacteriota bacterium]|nr:ATP-binding protein [Candidatus Margulisiibacteriota bacterium]
LGLINVADKNSGEPFSEKDLVFASTIAKYACNAIEAMLQCTDLKLEKDALDEQKSQLEKYASVGKLAAGVVHEVNNPLDGVIRYTNMLLSQIDSGSVTHEYLSEIKKGLHRIANTTKSLLDFSQRVNSNYSHHKRYVDIHAVIEDSLDALRDNIAAGVAIEKKFDNAIPKVMDLGLSHVVENIIKNSLDAMNGKGKIEILTGIDDKGMHLIFKDNGAGIPKDVLERIFEPFFTTKGVGKGTGLGLPICSEIIQKYKGKIKVDSTVGKGSTFTILIPKKYLENG